MKYNTQREKLILPEYGRGIQEMVDVCLGIEDRAERLACAETIVAIMGAMNPEVKQQPDYERKLWDQLAIMSNYQLDIDYPYEVVRQEDMQAKPRSLSYPKQRIRYRHYGHLTELFMAQLKAMPEGEERDALAGMLANNMKRSLFNWNRDAMDERKVEADIAQYTDGKVALSPDFNFIPVTSASIAEFGMGKKKKKK